MDAFYVCHDQHGGEQTVVQLLSGEGGALRCGDAPLQRLQPNTTDAAQEKHLPQVSVQGDTVRIQVGSAGHPMSAEHRIAWVWLQTEHGGQRRDFSPDDLPEAVFSLQGDRPVAVYAYCNLHGLWTTKL